MLGTIYNDIARDGWTNTPDNTMEITNNASGNPTSITYKQGNNVVFIKQFTYDANGYITKIECVKP